MCVWRHLPPRAGRPVVDFEVGSKQWSEKVGDKRGRVLTVYIVHWAIYPLPARWDSTGRALIWSSGAVRAAVGQQWTVRATVGSSSDRQ